MVLRAALLFVALTALPSVASAQRARLTVLADSVSVGEVVQVAVAVDHAPGVSAVFPTVPYGDIEAEPLLVFGDAEVSRLQRLPPRARGAVRTDSAVYDVVVFTVDRARVGPVVVRLAAGRDTVAVPTDVAVVPVRSEIAGETDPEPAPVGPPDPFPGLLPVWIALGAVAALVAGLMAWLVARRRRRPGPPVPRVAPHPEALAALTALAAAPPATPEAAAETALGAREALRVFLSRRLDVPALETTTDELDALLARDARVTPEARVAARRVLALADLVAFAGVAPSPETATEAVGTARGIVEDVERKSLEQERQRAEGGGQTANSEAPTLDDSPNSKRQTPNSLLP